MILYALEHYFETSDAPYPDLYPHPPSSKMKIEWFTCKYVKGAYMYYIVILEKRATYQSNNNTSTLPLQCRFLEG